LTNISCTQAEVIIITWVWEEEEKKKREREKNACTLINYKVTNPGERAMNYLASSINFQ
jgi:hypothetical protein